MKEFARTFYKSQAWKKTQAAYKASKGGLCERCLKRGLFVPGIIVHHKVHLTPENIDNPMIALDWNNLELVCRDCHAQEHSGIVKRYKIDELGRVSATA
jgi:5-methylcytosine-specific restriction endonuclease McrA